MMRSLWRPLVGHRLTPVARESLLSSTTLSQSLGAPRWSTTAISSAATGGTDPTMADRMAALRPPTFTRPQVLTTDDGRQMLLFDMRPHPKLKPGLVAARLRKMRTYSGQEKNIRHSPWRLNLVCQLAAGLTVEQALTQLHFSKKSKAPLVHKVIKRTSNLANTRDGVQMSQLEVAECFATKGTPLKRIKTMGRGRFGRMEHKHSHMRLVLREIDFPLKIYQAATLNQKQRWFMLQQQAEQDADRARLEREEMERLERQTAASAETST